MPSEGPCVTLAPGGAVCVGTQSATLGRPKGALRGWAGAAVEPKEVVLSCGCPSYQSRDGPLSDVLIVWWRVEGGSA